jgi:sugar lactone lactonase YvrE
MNFLCVSSDGNLWAGTEGSGLQRFNPATENLITYGYEQTMRIALPVTP